MAYEIERKFLVLSEIYKKEAYASFIIEQGYLNSHPARSVRVRIKENEAFITVKGKSSEDGLSRFEWEKPIAITDAKELLKLCEPGKIQKRRYLVQVADFLYEVDEFFGDNNGLVVAEVELSSEKEQPVYPDWLGKEVTGDARFYNAALVNKPFKTWGKE
ncbi:adenylate cyclase [Mesonia hippocampi]|uniref:Adenylate cyclase n=1 Tax=Mesonia hippocampi TaxID=1628250 RepID=A0A840EMI8_9FLAO|nr:CYTH domain-containing protein [Mesonia hippocampi]MBB4118325.1 adenylate cyclase [Mesonia hippocampi]